MGVNVYTPDYEEFAVYEFNDISTTIYLVDTIIKATTALHTDSDIFGTMEHPVHSYDMKNNPDDFEIVEVELKF